MTDEPEVQASPKTAREFEFQKTLTGWKADAVMLALALVIFVPWFVGVVAIVGWLT